MKKFLQKSWSLMNLNSSSNHSTNSSSNNNNKSNNNNNKKRRERRKGSKRKGNLPRQVSFDTKKIIERSIPNRQDLDIDQLWYSKKDTLDPECRLLLNLVQDRTIETSQSLSDMERHLGFCTRGLESRLPQASHGIRKARYESEGIVMQEQCIQNMTNRFNPERLAAKYAASCQTSQQEALLAAQHDAQEAFQIYHSSNKNNKNATISSSRSSMHSSKTNIAAVVGKNGNAVFPTAGVVPKSRYPTSSKSILRESAHQNLLELSRRT